MRIKFLILFIISLFFLLSCDLNTKFDNPYDKNSEAYIPDNDSDSDETDDDSDKTDTEPGNDEDEKTNTDDSSDSGITDNDSTDTAPDQGDSAHNDDTDTGSDDSDTDTKPDEDTDTTPDNESDEDEIQDEDEIDDSESSHSSVALGNICTGQTRCYNNTEEITCPTSSSADFFGQDAQYTSRCTAQSFTLGSGSQAGTVIDNKTGLIWEQSPSENTYTWEDAPNHCTELNNSNYGGKSNWRVPNPLELLTIVDGNKYGPATNSNFTNIPIGRDDFLWTSKDYGASLARAFRSYYGVYLYGESKTKTYKVLCVSGNELVAATSSDFTTQNINDEVVVKDATTGLMWQEGYATGKKTWQQALKHCEDLTYAGYSDWRLPNKNELASLLDPGKYGAPYSNFPDMPSNYFWSSSTASSDIDLAWRMDVIYGYVWYSDKSNTESVRCVRNADGSTQITAEEECAAANGTWNSSQNKCTKTVPCSDKPANTVWNGESSYTQEYVSGEWTSSVNTVYSEDAGECHFKCVTNFFWNGSACVNPCESDPCNGLSNSTEICSAISATNYSCGCENGYFWNGSACVNPCESAPCNGLSNSTGNCTAHSWQNYSCKCVSGYYWRGAEKGCIDKPLTLGNICTGLNKCYNESSEITCQSSSSDDFYGQDAHNSNKCVAQSFTLGTGAQAGTVIDNNTGLIWEQSPSSGTYTWANRATHCNELNSSNYAGINNWRVPNPSELLTIVDNSRYKPAINSNFTNIPDDGYLWTSTEYFGNTQYAYEFQTSHGKASYYTEKTRSFKVLCVHGDIMSKGIFTTTSESGKEVVKDSTTGLMWQKESVSKSWREALKYCDDSNYANYSDWRLPNKNELASLLNYDKQSEPLSDFPDIQNNSFWSSSTLSGAPAHAVTLNFPNGDVGNFIKDPIYSLYVICVRNAN